jgi:hypothetical protein
MGHDGLSPDHALAVFLTGPHERADGVAEGAHDLSLSVKVLDETVHLGVAHQVERRSRAAHDGQSVIVPGPGVLDLDGVVPLALFEDLEDAVHHFWRIDGVLLDGVDEALVHAQHQGERSDPFFRGQGDVVAGLSELVPWRLQLFAPEAQIGSQYEYFHRMLLFIMGNVISVRKSA